MAVLDQRGLEAAHAQTLALAGGISDADLERVPSPCSARRSGADGFAHGNERPQHQVEVDAFRLGRLPDGWEWRWREHVEGPPPWLEDGTGRRLTGVGELVLDRSVVHR